MPRPYRSNRIAPDAVEHLVSARGTQAFTARELGEALSCTRQTIYKHFAKLREQGWEIEGQPKLGFMARRRQP